MNWEDGDVPNGWVVRELGEVSKVVGGGTPKTSVTGNFSESEGHPWITPADLTNYTDRYIRQGERYLTEKGLAESSATYVPAGTVLFSSRAPIGHIAIAANPVTTNQGFRSFAPSDELDSEYLYYALKFLTPLAEQRASGTTFPELSGSKAARLPIAYPPLDEQRAIARVLNVASQELLSADEHIQTARQSMSRFRQKVVAAACSGQLTARWREGSGVGGQDSTGRLQWQRVSVASIAADVPRAIQSGPFGSNLLHSEFGPAGPLVIGIDNVLDGEFSMGREHRISDSKFEELSKYEARPMDVLITVMATVGRVCVLPGDIEPAIITKHVYRITADQSRVDPYFLMHALRAHPAVREQIQAQTHGQTRPGINGTVVKDLIVDLPPLDEQQEIVRRLSILIAAANEVDSRLAMAAKRAKAGSRSILAKAFRGELIRPERRG